MRVQCIKVGTHKNLEVGKWYDASDFYRDYRPLEYFIPTTSSINTTYFTPFFDKSLFITEQEKRDKILYNLLINSK